MDKCYYCMKTLGDMPLEDSRELLHYGGGGDVGHPLLLNCIKKKKERFLLSPKIVMNLPRACTNFCFEGEQYQSIR